jgi:hypothetical protein
MASWPNGKLAKWQVGLIASWPNGKLAKWQVGQIASWPNSKLTNEQVDEHQIDLICKLPKWQSG